MKKLAFVVLLLCSLILAGNSRLLAEEAYNMFRYFPLDVDDTWIYQSLLVSQEETGEGISITSVKEKIVLDGQDVYVLEMDLNTKPFFCYSANDQGIYLHKLIEGDCSSIFIPPMPFITNPMQLNKENTFSCKAELYDAQGEFVEEYKAEVSQKFEGLESVTVPMGRFDNCLKIKVTVSLNRKNHASRFEDTLWLAKDIGTVKEKNVITEFGGGTHVFRNQRELVKAILQKNR